MTVLASLSGQYRVELTAGDVPMILEQAIQKGVHLQNVSWKNDLTIQFSVSRAQYKRLTPLAEQRGAQVQILSQQGFYWDVVTLLSRPVFFAGMILLLLFGIFLPTRIFFVDVQGNSTVETARILESASEFGIKFGASRRLVRSEQVKNQLIGAMPELGWVGINTKGCVAVISVREKVVQEPLSEELDPCNIVASRDGIILDCAVSRGNLHCAIGQAVSKGEILISGRGSIMQVDTLTGASGEIFAATERHLWLVTPNIAQTRGQNRQGKAFYSLQIGKNLINFFKGSGISSGSCVKMYSKYVLTLPRDFSLPVALIKWSIDSCEITSGTIPEEEAYRLLSDFAVSYLEEQMIAGRILRKDEVSAQSDGIYHLTGDYACTEMIGRAQKEQIGAYHGKTD